MVSAIRELVSEHVDPPTDDAAPLALKSFQLVVLAEALEDKFAIRVRALDMTPGNFGSIARIAAFVAAARNRQ